MKNLYSIGEVSKIKKITIKALRYYHKMGILIPRYIDEETGYRYYSIDQFIYIDVIKGCRALETSISELQEIFKECDTEKLIKFLQLKRNKAKENIIRMKEIIINIDDLEKNFIHSKELLNDDDISIEYFNERYIVVVPCEEVGNLKELISYSNLETIIKEENLKVSMDRGIIYEFNSHDEVKPKFVFNQIEYDDNIEINENIKILPKGKYITIAYTKQTEGERMKKFNDYITLNKVKGKIFAEIDLFDDFLNINSYSCQIQMFIE